MGHECEYAQTRHAECHARPDDDSLVSIIKFSGILKSVHLSSVIHQIQGKGGCYTGATR